MSDENTNLSSSCIRALYEYAPRTLPVNIILITVLFFILQKQAPFNILAISWLSVSLLAIVRVIHALFCHKKDDLWFETHKRSLKVIFILGSLLSGLTWGLIYIILTPHMPLVRYDYLLLLIIGGLVSGSVISMATYAPAFFVFAIPALILPLIAFLSDWHKESLLIALIIIIFFTAISITYIQSRNMILGGMRLQFEKENLLKELGHTNQQLLIANKKVTMLSNTDELTDLANRRHFLDVYEREWNRCRRSHAYISLIMIDIDYFKLYNDHYGHLAGDACLRTIATIFKTHARRSSDLVIRYGGEEFILLLPETPLAGALHVAKFIQESLAIANIPNEASPIAPFITVSMGVASVIPNDKLLNELIARADQQLYMAKKGGRNRIVG